MVRHRPIVVIRINWLWYVISLPLILLLGYAALENWISSYFLVAASFLAVFWTVSFLFALATLFSKPVEPRQ